MHKTSKTTDIACAKKNCDANLYCRCDGKDATNESSEEIKKKQINTCMLTYTDMKACGKTTIRRANIYMQIYVIRLSNIRQSDVKLQLME